MFKKKFTMIKCPPGTVKSYLCSILVYHSLKLKKTEGHILICAPSNKALDNICNYISKLGITIFKSFIKEKRRITRRKHRKFIT